MASDSSRGNDVAKEAKKADWARTPVTPGTQELRIATAMTGGVSLAIWMGGIARELNLLEQAARRRTAPPDAPIEPAAPGDDGREAALDLYLRLLDLVDVTVNIDMLSGTSAGGINAALLGFTRSRQADLGPLRDIWLNTGSFDLLLRDPAEKSPPSLLQGDGVLLTQLAKGIGDLAKPAPPPPLPATQVFITTTLLTGETTTFTDSFGTQVSDVDHHGLFTFDAKQLAGPGINSALALAARCSASFPAAFEPAFVPCGGEPQKGVGADHPDMQPYANTTRAHFVADGGLLMNQPIAPLLTAILDQPAERQVRRVLLYVTPTAGDPPDPENAPKPDQFSKPYTFVESLLKDLGSVLSQSISADLRTLREHKDRVRAIGDTRLRVAELGMPLGRNLLTQAALTDYRTRQSAALANSIVTALLRAVTTKPIEQLPPRWIEALRPGGPAEERCWNAARDAITDGWWAAVPTPGQRGPIATFGRSPYDGAKATVLAMLSAGWDLASATDDRSDLATAVKKVHDALLPPVRLNLAGEANARVADIGPDSATTLEAIATELATTIAGSTDPQLQNMLVTGWLSLAAALVDVIPLLRNLAQFVESVAAVAPGPNAVRRAAACAELRTYLAYLESSATAAGEPPAAVSVDTVVSSLFQLEVVVRSMLPTRVEVDQQVELVQVSADTRTKLAPKRPTARSKLTGLQLHHFGAFYKSSWRANDWMWGRLDGAGWLVHLLLDPRRILVLAEAEGRPMGGRAAWFRDQLVARFPELDPPSDEIIAQLAYLDNPTRAMPLSLPEVAMWLATAWQRHIAVAELPVVARQIVANPTLRTNDWAVDVLIMANAPKSVLAAAQGATAAVTTGHWTNQQRKLQKWAFEHPTPDLTGPQQAALVAKLKDCPVPDEKLGNEIGEPLFTRTVTKATAVAAAATGESQELPKILKPVFATLRAATLLAYRVAAMTRGWPRRVALAGAGAIVLGFFVAMSFGSVLGLSGAVIAIAGAFLVLLVSWRSLERWRSWITLGLAAIAAAILVLLITKRSWLFGSGKDLGVVGRPVRRWLRHGLPDWFRDSAIPWLRGPWWHAPLAFSVLVFVVVALGSRRPKRRKGPTMPTPREP